MIRKKVLTLGTLLLLGVFVLGAGIPAMAANGAAQAGIGYRAQTMIKSLADLTGLDLSAIQAERHTGRSILDIAAENGVDRDTLVAAITETNQANLTERLNNGTITQEQYDTCMLQMEQRIQERLERTDVGGAGMRQGHGGVQGGQGHRQGGQGQGANGLGQGNGTGNCPIQTTAN